MGSKIAENETVISKARMRSQATFKYLKGNNHHSSSHKNGVQFRKKKVYISHPSILYSSCFQIFPILNLNTNLTTVGVYEVF